MTEDPSGTGRHRRHVGTLPIRQPVRQRGSIRRRLRFARFERARDQTRGRAVEFVTGDPRQRTGRLGEAGGAGVPEFAAGEGSERDDRAVGGQSAPIGGGEHLLTAPIGLGREAGEIEPPGRLTGDDRVGVAGGEDEVADHPSPGGDEVDIGNLDGERRAGDGPPPGCDVGRIGRPGRELTVDTDDETNGLAVRNRDQQRHGIATVRRRLGGTSVDLIPDVRAGHDRPGVHTGADPPRPVEPGPAQVGVERAADEPRGRDDDGVRRRVLVLDHDGPAVAVVDDTDPLYDVAPGHPHPGLVDRRVVDPVLTDGGLLARPAPVRPRQHSPLEPP